MIFLFLNIMYCAYAIENNKRVLIDQIACLENKRISEINSCNDLNDLLRRSINFDTLETKNKIEYKRVNILAMNYEIGYLKNKLDILNGKLRNFK